MSINATTLLVVDSDPLLTRALVDELQRHGFAQVLQANDVASALQQLRQAPVSLVLSEQNLTGSTGLALFEGMRSDEALAEIPFVLMSSAMQRQDVQRAIQLGIRDLLVKPFTTQRLLERIQRSLQRDDLLAQTSLPQGEERASILVVDDTPENLQLLAGLFRDQFKVKLAHNGEKAIAICHSDNPPDLILLDVMMPDMDGFEVARRLRQHHASEHIPIIFVTALSDERSREQGLSLGAVDYVFKPIDPTLLRIRVRNLMRYVEHRRQLQTDLDQLLELAALRADMLHLISHDLLQPLSQCTEALQSLTQDAALNPAQKQQVQLATQGSQQMKELLALAGEQLSLEAGQRELRPESIRLNPLLRELIGELRQRYGDRGVDIQLETALGSSTAVMADPGLCHALLYRVLKHAHAACPVGSQLSLVMIDENPAQVKLLLPARPASNKPLAAARALARAQGGDVQHEDDGANCVIRVSLPRA
ncbi:ATP-binding response regulator [Pseudomonas peli]|uniref:ATP-binding response regulator n=1 Tax=Pseudomonas peli TaxID=592361 RepID=UPI003D31DB6C